MRKILLLLAVVFVLYLVFGGKDENPDLVEKSQLNPNKAVFLDRLKKEEPKVKDFVLTDANVLYVAVFDDGTNRDGFASYFCQLASEDGINLFKVVVVKYGSMKSKERDNAYGITLGESQCN
jgi:hypothetical protein